MAKINLSCALALTFGISACTPQKPARAQNELQAPSPSATTQTTEKLLDPQTKQQNLTSLLTQKSANETPKSDSDHPLKQNAFISVTTPEEIAAFAAEFCRRVQLNDETWFKTYVKMSSEGHIRGHTIVDTNENPTDPLLGGNIFLEPKHLANWPLCEAMPLAPDLFTNIQSFSNKIQGQVKIKGFDYRLLFEQNENGFPQLVEFSVEFPHRAFVANKKKVKSKRKFELYGRVIAAKPEFEGNVIGGFIVSRLESEPNCIRNYATKPRPVSASLRVYAIKEDGREVQVRVYARSAVSSSLLACLEEQLQTEFSQVFRGIPWEVDYFLTIAIPLREHELDQSVPTVRIGTGEPE